METQNKKVSLKERFKSFKAETWIILALELIMTVVLFYFDINFWIDMAKGITFFGEKNKGYEIAISIVLLLMGLALLFVLIHDTFIRDYVKEGLNTTEKVIRGGRVIQLDSEAEKAKKLEKVAKEESKKEESKDSSKKE